MKALTATLILFALLIGVVVANSIYVRSVSQKIGDIAEDLKTASSKEDAISNLKSIWHRNKPYLNLSIRANEIERMNDLIEALEASYNAQNEAEFQKYCILISELAEEFSHYETISPNSVF